MRESDRNEALGLAHFSVRLRDHDPRWARLYDTEAKLITEAIGKSLISLQHHGSTSIPGIKAKPILDMIGGLAHLGDALALEPALASIGYEYAPQAGVPGHHVFGKACPRTHLLHLVEFGSQTWFDAINFRNRLLADPALAQQYELLKLGLAQRYPEDRARYTSGKTDFIRAVLAGDAE